MRAFLHASLMAALIAGSGACNRHDDKMDKANTQMQKAAEDLNVKNRDVAKDEGDLAAARDRYVTSARERLAQVDAKINELSAKADAKSRETAASLKVRRDEIAHEIDVSKDHASKDWDSFKKSVDDSFDKLENDVNDALK
jgi:hypothetical protein